MVSNCGECTKDNKKPSLSKDKTFNKLLRDEKVLFTNKFKNEALKCEKNIEERKLIIDLEREYCEKMRYAGEELEKKK